MTGDPTQTTTASPWRSWCYLVWLSWQRQMRARLMVWVAVGLLAFMTFLVYLNTHFGLWSMAVRRQMDAGTSLNNAVSADRYFESLPLSFITAQTDSEGKFTLTFPKRGRYALVGKAIRKVADGDEVYHWMVWVEADGNAKKVTLSNNNTADSGSPDCVLTSDRSIERTLRADLEALKAQVDDVAGSQ